MYRVGSEGHLEKPEVYDAPGTKGSAMTETTFASPAQASLASSAEAAVAFWVASNNERAGATTDTLIDAQMCIRDSDSPLGPSRTIECGMRTATGLNLILMRAQWS